jgi:hypothetical protein
LFLHVAMAGLAATVPCFDQLLDSSQPKDTEVIIVEEDSSSAEHTSDVSNTDQEGAGRKRSRQETCSSRITLEAHWVVLYSLSSYFQAKVGTGATVCTCMPAASAQD